MSYFKRDGPSDLIIIKIKIFELVECPRREGMTPLRWLILRSK